MPAAIDLPAWIALFTGLYALAAAVGELREPGSFSALVEDLELSPAARFLAGLLCIALGATLYLAIPFHPAIERADWLAVTLSAIGGLAVAEGMLILAAGERFLAMAGRMMGRHSQVWAAVAALFGAALIFAAIGRIE